VPAAGRELNAILAALHSHWCVLILHDFCDTVAARAGVDMTPAAPDAMVKTRLRWRPGHQRAFGTSRTSQANTPLSAAEARADKGRELLDFRKVTQLRHWAQRALSHAGQSRLQFCAEQAELGANQIEVGFDVEELFRVLHRNREQMNGSINAREIRLERSDIRTFNIVVQG
jgi:hypothetical protein